MNKGISFKKVLAGPFRRANEINRSVIAGWLVRYSGTFLEVGAGEAPLLDSLTVDHRKIILDLPQVAELVNCSKYQYLGQNAGEDKWDLPDNSVDVVVSNQCLEHIPKTDHFISEAHRVLKPNGIFIISVPNQGALAFIFLLLLTINPPMNFVSDRFYGLGNPLSNIRFNTRNISSYSHLRLFATRAMCDLLKLHGFQVKKKHGGSWGLPICGKLFARIMPYYGLYTTILSQKSK